MICPLSTIGLSSKLAKGLSTGLIYSPSCYADEDELVELCKIVAEYNGFYATHMRNEAASVVDSVKVPVYLHDTTFVEVPITQKYYHEDSLYDAWVSGFLPQLDSIQVM